MIKMSINNIRKSMSYERKILDWKNIRTTNCYAYALRIDIPQNSICKYAYDLGGISRMIDSDEEPDFDKVPPYSETYDVDLTSDFDLLGLEYEESDTPELVNKDLHYYPGRYFDILFFLSNQIDDFHFARYGNDGKLYHKRGFVKPPQETTMEYINSKGYEFVKRYRLYLSKGPFYK